MLRTLPTVIRMLTLCGIIAASIAIPPTPFLYAEENTPTNINAPTDTPTPVVTDNVEEWTVGNGLVYWAETCYADEFNGHADITRKPVSGSAVRLLQSIDSTDVARCNTYFNQLSSTNGLYYFNLDQSRIERMPLSPPPNSAPDAQYVPVEIKTLTSDQQPRNNLPFIEANGFLYWVGFQTVLRIRKNGSGEVETVANTAQFPTDVLVVGNVVYWTDSGGVKAISINCATLPCSDNSSTLVSFGATTRGYGLTYQPPSGGSVINSAYRVYWVQSTNNVYKIRYCSINQLIPCYDEVILPLNAASPASPEVFPPVDFYVAAANQYIGHPLFANVNGTGQLFWTERHVNPIVSHLGGLRRRATNAATPNTQSDEIATNQVDIDNRIFATTDSVFFALQHNGIYSLSLGATAITRDFSITKDGGGAMEVTQAIQNLDNSAPLVAKKATYVRAYGKQLDGPNAPNVEARLIGTKNGSPLPGSPLQSVNGVRSLVTGGSYDRARLNDGWLFQLPDSWLPTGAVTLKVEVDPLRRYTDPNRGNNELSQTVTFQNQPPVCVWTVPVRTHTPKPSINDPNFWSMVDQFNRRWPVPATWIFRDTDPVEELEFCSWHGFPYPCHGPYELEDGWGITNGIPDRDKVIVSLWGRALLSFNPDACDDIGAPVHFMGMVHPDANNGGASGYASTVSNQSWVQLPDHLPNPMPVAWDSMREGSTMAQELAHNQDRNHVNCGNPDNIDSSYPYPPCQIGDVDPSGYYGFDIASRQPIRPNQTADFMSYSRRSWVSDYTWRALLGAFATVNVASASPVTVDAGESVFVTGLVDEENNRGEIASLLILPTASVPPATRQAADVQAAGADHGSEPHATFKLRLLDSVGTILIERTLTLTPLDDHSGDGASALFTDLFPKPTGTVATIQLLADSSVIDSIQPGSAAPVVTISAPTAGSMIDNSLSIQWNASDANPADQLLFTLQYSHDGGAKWHTLNNDYPSDPTGQYNVTYNDLGSLPGSAANAALIRILASDGYNTTIATSKPFTLKNRKPDLFITTPGSGDSVAAGEVVVLRGGATDAEDGGLSDNALTWAMDGVVAGSGGEVAVAGLSTGAHTVVLTATDSISNSAVATVNFSVAPLAIPLAAAPTLDGNCDDVGYANGTPLQTKPYADNSQAIVRLMRSADYLWACFSGMAKGATDPGAFAGLHVDVDNSGSALAQAGDIGFFAGEDGDVFTLAGDGAGGFAAGPGGLVAQMSTADNSWNAELRIDKATLGGWDHLVRLDVGHYWVAAQDDDYLWPYRSLSSSPKSWASAALGDQPAITALDEYSATVGSPAFTLGIEGSNFVSGTVALWNGTAVTTAISDSTHISATIDIAQLNSAGTVQVSVRSAAPGNFESNKLSFIVEALNPVITSFAPSTLYEGSPTTTITVTGSNFAADAQVLWNGVPLATTFVSPTQVKVQVAASLLEFGKTAGVAVRNQSPQERISDAKPFVVEGLDNLVFLPVVSR